MTTLWTAAKVAGAWLLAGVVSLWVAATTHLGPTVLELSPTHGIHVGDVLAVVTCSAWAIEASRPRPRRPGLWWWSGRASIP